MKNWRELEIKTDTIIKNEKVLLAIGDSAVWSTNALSCITGLAKSRKSFLKDFMLSKAFTNDDTFTGNLTGRVLCVDTEQSDTWVQKSVRRLEAMGVNLDDYTMLATKRFSPKDRLKILEETIIDLRPELVVIDGIRDLLLDINDVKESMVLVNELMRLVNDHRIHICSILHSNPDGQKVRGHLGTEILNKCDSVIKVTTRGSSNISTVTSEVMRDKHFLTWKFKVDENGLPYEAE